MANTIGLAKQEARDALEGAQINAFDYIPERVNPPMAIIAAGNPFLEAGDKQTFKDHVLRLDVTLVAGRATNEKATDEMEDLICGAMLAFEQWDIESVSQPFQLEANGALYLAATLTVTAYITIKNEEVI